MDLFTIGYEGHTQADVLDRLNAAGVSQVIDVRAVASSRKAGFSKTLLAASLAATGIGYIHLRALGTPKPGRQAAHKGDIGAMRAIYAEHMAEPESEAAFQQLREAARDKPSALLCYEADPAGCHRTILADRLAAEDGFRIVNL